MKRRRQDDAPVPGSVRERGRVRRVAMVSVHTSPLDQPGTGDGGGLNVYVMETGRRLAARGVQVDVFTRASSPDLDPIVYAADGFAVHHVVAGPRSPIDKNELPDHLWAFLLGTENHVNAHGISRAYDALHSHYWLSGWVGRRLRDRWGVPLVQSFHTLARVKNAALAPDDEPEPTVRLQAEASIVDEADRIIVPVCGEARMLHRTYGTSGARLSVVRPGVDLDRFRSDGPAEVPPEAPPGDGPLLLFVGRLQPLKGPDVAIRTLAEVRRDVPDTRLLMIGGASGSGRDLSTPQHLRTMAAELGVADAVGVGPARPQQVLSRIYRAADVLLVPSRSESFGLVALEAQASGTPVVAANVGGLRAVVDGGGTLVDGHDPRAHADAVLEFLRDDELRAHTSAAGIRNAAGASWERTVDGLIEVYREVGSEVVERGVAGA